MYVRMRTRTALKASPAYSVAAPSSGIEDSIRGEKGSKATVLTPILHRISPGLRDPFNSNILQSLGISPPPMDQNHTYTKFYIYDVLKLDTQELAANGSET